MQMAVFIANLSFQIEPRLNSLLQVSAARQEDGRFLVPVKLVSIHTDTECAISAFDELAGVTYTLPVHITVGNFSAGKLFMLVDTDSTLLAVNRHLKIITSNKIILFVCFE